LLEFNGASSKAIIDGSSWTNAAASPGSYAWTGIIVGGLEVDGAQFWNGDIGEVVVWAGQLHATNVVNWTNYTNAKWGK